MHKTISAFEWIINILRKHDIPFQVGMGLAAKSYGSTRELADIDIFIPNNKFKTILPDIKGYITIGPEQSIDAHWNIYFVELEYANQKIELGGGTEFKIFDYTKKYWLTEKINFSNSTKKEIFGIEVPVMPREVLIRLKSKLLREVDRIDLSQINQG